MFYNRGDGDKSISIIADKRSSGRHKQKVVASISVKKIQRRGQAAFGMRPTNT